LQEPSGFPKVSDVLSGAQVHGSQPDPWGTMASGAPLSTFLGEGPVAGVQHNNGKEDNEKT